MQPSPSKKFDPAAQLAQKVAHELNSPLDGVMRFISLAQRQIKEGRYEDIQRYLADAEFGLQRMAEILRDLTDTPAPGTTLHKAPIAEILDQCIRTLAPLAERQRVTVRLTVPQPSPAADIHLYQVACNILRNAIEASPAGEAVDVTANALNGTLTLSVTDAGPGIPEAAALRLFEPFFTTKSQQGGTGLGLALSRDILTKLGGTIALRNTPHRGCQVVVTLPIGV